MRHFRGPEPSAHRTYNIQSMPSIVRTYNVQSMPSIVRKTPESLQVCI